VCGFARFEHAHEGPCSVAESTTLCRERTRIGEGLGCHRERNAIHDHTICWEANFVCEGVTEFEGLFDDEMFGKRNHNDRSTAWREEFARNTVTHLKEGT
jgi:hypothetical protein